MKTLYMTPAEICEYWHEHLGDTSPHKIAENSSRAAEVFISCGEELQFTVIKDGDVIAEYEALSETEVEDVLDDINEEIEDIVPDNLVATDEEVITSREIELTGFLEDFIYAVTDGEEYGIEDAESALDKMCAFLYKEFGLSIYRPMILVDEDGKEERYDYPYEYLDLDEEIAV